MILLSACAASVAENPPAPSPFIGVLWNVPGVLVVASRQKRVAVRPLGAVASVSWQETVTGWRDVGTPGKCRTF